MFKPQNIGLWGFDCAELVQATRLYALLHTMTARGFDAAFDPKHTGKDFIFRPQDSTGVTWTRRYTRVGLDSKIGSIVRLVTPDMRATVVDVSLDSVLSSAPYGSRVAWYVPNFPQNAIKRHGTFQAHGTWRKRKVTFPQLRAMILAKTGHGNPELVEVEEYGVPRN